MSLRARLVLVVVLAALALIAAVLAIMHALTSTDAARWARAEESASTMASAYADHASDAPTVLAHVQDADLGTCSPFAVTASSRHHPPPGDALAPLPPDQRDEVERACASGTDRRIEHPNDLLAIAVHGRVWAIRRVPRLADPDARSWHLEAILLGTATIALVIVAVSALVALQRGARTLEGSLAILARDPRARPKVPRVAELARIGTGLGDMATKLADSHERERDLTRDLEQGERLRSLGRVSAGIAHEVRNPLAGMKLQLDVLDRSPALPDAARTSVRACLHEIGRLDRLVTSLLGVARHPPRRDATLDLRELVARRVVLLGLDRIDIEGDGTAPGDPDATAQIIENLIRNAADATEARVTVEVGPKRLAVVDAGPGIDAVDRLFEPFHTTKPDGTGLGLWMCRTLAEAQGAVLRYERRDDHTRFELEWLA